MRAVNLVFVLCVMIVLSSCSTTDDKYEDRPLPELYNAAMDALEKKSYQEAAKTFDEVDRQYPYSHWATQAQVMAAYAHYKGQKYDRAIVALESFLQLHPANANVPYALYLNGLCYYEQISASARDQKDTETALLLFKELLARFPASDYARDARLKMNLLEDALAGKEMEVGRFYLERKAYGAAINRFKVVVMRFDTTRQIEEALYRLVECYSALSLKDQAQQCSAVLGHNYPNSPWYVEAYKLTGEVPITSDIKGIRDQQESWIDKLKNWYKGMPKQDT